ncbi:FMN-binding protein [bacterium]|nr:FMN-binding protein [bacterium]
MDVLVRHATLYLLIVLASLCMPGSDACASQGLAELKALWPGVDSLATWTLDDSLAHEAQLRLPNSPNDSPVKITSLFKHSDLIGWALERNAMGRYEPFTFSLAVDTSGTLRAMKVLEYRSMYGGEIQTDGFLHQFLGLNQPDRIRVGQAIDAVSGASISSRSIAEETRYTLMAIQWLQSIGALQP